MPNLADVLRAAIDSDKTRIQYIQGCIVQAQKLRAKKGEKANTKVTFVTDSYEPGDMMGERKGRVPNVGIILWIPLDLYRELTGEANGE